MYCIFKQSLFLPFLKTVERRQLHAQQKKLKKKQKNNCRRQKGSLYDTLGVQKIIMHGS